MSRLARFRDVFEPRREPIRALFCTYGFDARFFEAEVLPALLPTSLALDRESGSLPAYLNAADIALQRRSVTVFYDHLLGDGPELCYARWRVDALPRRFHAKLILLDYGDFVRAVIGSTNLTRAAWTHLIELFVYEDLRPGEPHPWTSGLRSFLNALAAQVPASCGKQQGEVQQLLGEVLEIAGADRVTSTWSEPLLDALFAGFPDPTRIDVVTPFFEGSDGPGVFDALASRAPSAHGRLFASGADVDGRVQFTGPARKLVALAAGGKWELHRVQQVWDGDDEAAPLRSLHGKLLGLTAARRSRLMVGSANVTRAALLGKATLDRQPGPANVELVVLRDCSSRELADVLPQSAPLAFADANFVDAADIDGADETLAGLERFVIAASYSATAAQLLLELTPDAPSLSVDYDDCHLGEASALATQLPLTLGVPGFIVISVAEESAIVPFTIVDPESLIPRGTALTIDLAGFCEMLAGGREVPLADIPGRSEARIGQPVATTEIGGRGPIPWRRVLAAIRGLSDEAARECRDERGLRFTLDNPLRLQGLLDRLNDAYDAGRMTAPNLLYALYEIEHAIAHVAALEMPGACATLLSERRTSLRERFDALLATSTGHVRAQLDLIRKADGRR